MKHISRYRKQLRREAHGSARGMTLIEIMVVITILGLIAAAVGVAVIPQLNHAKVERAKQDIMSIGNALNLYYTQKGKYPDTGEGLQALVTNRQLDAAPKDPWGHDYIYTMENGKPVVTTYGSDGAPGGDDDATDISTKDVQGGNTASANK